MAIYADFGWFEVGERIRARRLAQQKTQQRLASAAGLTQNAIFRLEAGDTNPQIDTLRAVATALDTNVRELICGVAEAEPAIRDRLRLIRRIVESGDEGAIRVMDHGLEGAQTVLDRTIGLLQNEPSYIRIGERTIRRSPKKQSETMELTNELSSSKSESNTAPKSLRQSRRTSTFSKEEIEEMSGHRLDDASHLPEGTANKFAAPYSNRLRKQHANPERSAEAAESEKQRHS